MREDINANARLYYGVPLQLCAWPLWPREARKPPPGFTQAQNESSVNNSKVMRQSTSAS